MDQHALELEDLREDHGVSSYTVTNSLNLEREVYTQRASLQAPPSPPQMANRQRSAQLPRALAVAYTLPHQTCEFSLQIIDLTQGWPDAVTGQIIRTDLLALIAAVYIHVKLRFTPEQRYPHRLRQLLEALTALLLQRQHYAVPALRGAQISQQVVHQEFDLLRQLDHEHAILTPAEWSEICQLRCTLRQQPQRSPTYQEREETVTVTLAFAALRLPMQPHLRS